MEIAAVSTKNSRPPSTMTSTLRSARPTKRRVRWTCGRWSSTVSLNQPHSYLASKMVQPYEPEFEQALAELSQSLTKFLEANPEYKKALEIVQIPERVIQFRVVWEDDQGKSQVNRGYRVQVRGCYVTSTKHLDRSAAFSITLHSVPTRVASVCTPLLSECELYLGARMS